MARLITSGALVVFYGVLAYHVGYPMSQLARNTFLLTAASIGQKAIAFLYFALIARTIGEASTGSYFLALGLTTTIGVFGDVGLTSVLIREVAREKDHALKHVRTVLGNKLLTIPVTVALALILPKLLGFDADAARLTHVAIAIMLLDSISLSYFGVLRGFQNLKFESIGIFIGQLLTTTIGAAALLLHATDLAFLIAALIAGSFWNAAFSVGNVVRRLGVQAMIPTFTEGLRPLRTSFMFFLAAVFVKIYSYVDSFTINMTFGQAAVGVYAVAYKLTYAFQFLPLAFIGALYPTMSAQAHEPEKLRETFLKAEWYVAFLSAPIVFGLFALAPKIITFFYTSKFAEAAPTLQILVFALLFIFIDYPVGSLLNATGRQATKTAIMGITMLINIAANLILVPRLGIEGAGVAALISFSLMFTMGFVMVGRVIRVSLFDLLPFAGGSLASGAVMAAVVMILETYVSWIATIPLGAVVFFAVAFLTRSLTVEHLQVLWRLLPKFRQNGIKEEISSV